MISLLFTVSEIAFDLDNSGLDFILPLQAGRGDALSKLLLSQEVND